MSGGEAGSGPKPSPAVLSRAPLRSGSEQKSGRARDGKQTLSCQAPGNWAAEPAAGPGQGCGGLGGGAETGVQERFLSKGGMGRSCRPSAYPGCEGPSTGVFLDSALYFHGAWAGARLGTAGGGPWRPGCTIREPESRLCPRHGLGLRGNTAEPLPLPQVFCAPDQAHCWETQGSAQTCRQSGGGGVPGWPPLPRAQGSCRLPQREGHGAVWKRENALRVWSGEAPAGMEASDRQQAWRCVGEGLGGTVGRSRRRKKPCLESGPRVLGVTVGRRKLRTGHPGAGSPVVHTTLGNEASLQPWGGGCQAHGRDRRRWPGDSGKPSGWAVPCLPRVAQG